MRRLTPLLLVALLPALVAAGCGSDKKSEKSGGAPLTKAEFLKRGNAICTQGNKDIDARGKEMFGTTKKRPSDAQLKRFATEVLIPSVQSQVDKIRALPAPRGDEAKVKAILDAADEGLAKMKQDPVAGVKSESGGPFARANKLARDYGLKVCGS